MSQNKTAVPDSGKGMNPDIKDSGGITIKDRFKVPQGFERILVKGESFEEYLRSLPLKPDGEKVHYFDGRVKR